MSYKHLHRQLRRLPFPQEILTDGGTIIKRHYVLGKTKEISMLFDSILIEEQYKQLPKVLDFIYKDIKPDWLVKFMNTLYIQLKGKWPTMELMKKLPQTKNEEFSVAETLLGKSFELPLLTQYSNQKDTTSEMIDNVSKLYNFIVFYRAAFGVSKHIMDVVYLPSKLGTVQHPISRDIQLKEKIWLVRKVVKEFQPILKQSLDRLILIYKTNSPITPNFYKHISRLRAADTSKSSTARKLFRKEFVPNKDDVYEIILEYLQKLFYLLENNEYILNLEY